LSLYFGKRIKSRKSERSAQQPEQTISTTKHNLTEFEQIATRLRLHVVNMVAPSGQGYVQQGLGAADIFTALYFAEASMDPKNPTCPDRDRIFLTTAHNTAIFYATLAERGFFDTDLLSTYVQDGSALEINSCERMGAPWAVLWQLSGKVETRVITSFSAMVKCKKVKYGKPPCMLELKV